jgi:hypothetical protein
MRKTGQQWREGLRAREPDGQSATMPQALTSPHSRAHDKILLRHASSGARDFLFDCNLARGDNNCPASPPQSLSRIRSNFDASFFDARILFAPVNSA